MTTLSRTVRNGDVPLACVDHGGAGPDLVLMHGAGMTQSSLAALIAHLDGYRVVTFDFRGHGDTPAAEWTMDTAIGDLEAVIAGYRLADPAVAGHSLGGMVAAEYARRHPDCSAAVNIDGHGMGSLSQYVDKDPVLVKEWQDRNKALAKKITGSPIFRGVMFVARVTGRAKPADKRCVHSATDMVLELDLIALYSQVEGPLQVFNAYAPAKGLGAKLSKDPDDFAGAYRRGIRRDMTALSESKKNVELAEVDATHMLIRTHPEQTARLMRTFFEANGLVPAQRQTPV